MKRLIRALLAAALALPLASYAAISGTKVYSAGGTVAASAWPATVDLTGHTPTAGNILVACQSRNNDASGLTATTPSGWTAGPEYGNGSAGALAGAMFWKKSAGNETSVSLTWSDTSQAGTWTYVELPGADLNVDAVGDSGDNEANVASATTSLSSGSATNSTATGLAVACLMTDNGLDNDVSGWSGSYNEQQESNYTSGGTAYAETFLATKVLSSSASQSTAGTITSASGYGAILVFNASGSTCPATCAGGRSARCITDTSNNTDPNNILYGQSPAVTANEDTVCYDAASALGDTVNVTTDGYPSFASAGKTATDSFDYCIMDNGAACGTDGKYEVSFQPVIESVTGIATGQTTADLTVTPVGPYEGTVYAVAITQASYAAYGAPSHTEIAAGQDGNGAAATYASSAAAASENNFSATGLTAGTAYRTCGGWANTADTPLTATVLCSDQWATTAAGDTTPDAYSFTDVTNQPLDSLIASNIITVTGIDASTAVTISGDPSCEFAINGGTATATESSITNNQTLQLFVRTESLGSDQFTCQVTIGGVSDTWSVTTMGAQGEPNYAARDIFEWFALQGYSGSNTERAIKYLHAQGYSGSFNSMMFKWLRDLGYTGSLTGMIDKFEREYTSAHG